MSEHPVPVRAAIDLAGLQPAEVRVEVVVGTRAVPMAGWKIPK